MPLRSPAVCTKSAGRVEVLADRRSRRRRRPGRSGRAPRGSAASADRRSGPRRFSWPWRRCARCSRNRAGPESGESFSGPPDRPGVDARLFVGRRLEEADRALDGRVANCRTGTRRRRGRTCRAVPLGVLGRPRAAHVAPASRPRKSPRPRVSFGASGPLFDASSSCAISFIARSPSLPTSTSRTRSGSSGLFGSSVTASATWPWKSDQTSSSFTPALPSASAIFCSGSGAASRGTSARKAPARWRRAESALMCCLKAGMLRTVTKATVSSGAAFSNAGAAQAPRRRGQQAQHGKHGAALFHTSLPFSTRKTATNLAAKRRKRRKK